MVSTWRTFGPSPEERAVLQKVADNNSYWCSPENIILALLVDPESRENRQRGFDLIVAIRAKKRGRGRQRLVRRFVKPSPSLNAVSYDTLIDLEDPKLEHFEPPVTQGLPIEKLEACIEDWNALDLPALPVHSQPVERTVKDVSEVVSVCKTQETRDRRILIRQDHRKNRHETLSKPSI